MDTAIATHFPCCLLKDKELVTLRSSKEEVEQVQNREALLSKEQYCLFYIETKPGVNAKKKTLFRSSTIKDFRKLCVYGEKGQTFREVLNDDGRFSDFLGEFKLADIEKSETDIGCDEKIDRHHGKTLQICFTHGNTYDPKTTARRIKTLPEPKVLRVDEVLRNARKEEDVQKIYERLREMHPKLRDTMRRRYPGNTFQEALKKVDFGKAQKLFNDCYRLEKLLKLGKSVCKLIVGDIKEGTAFVLFDNFILTNTHLFYDEGNWLTDVPIHAQFNYLTQSNTKKSFYLLVKNKFCVFDKDMDYAVLELSESDQANKKVPNGLMKSFSPIPKSGEACIIGHPKGEPRKLDTVCIIEKEWRGEAVNRHVTSLTSDLRVLSRIVDELNKQNHELGNIVMSDNVLSYDDSCMYHGSSGSPVFDAQCRVVALHTSGFAYDEPVKGTALGFGQPVLQIFEHFVSQVEDARDQDLLKRIREASRGNTHLEKILDMEPMDID